MSGIVSLHPGGSDKTMLGGWLKNVVLNQVFSSLTGLCLVAGGATQLMAGSDASSTVAPPLRVAISETLVYGLNLSDARAAMAVWATELLNTINLKLAPDQDWVVSSDQLLAAIRGGTVDLFCITVQEYRQVVPYVDTSRIITDDFGGEELLLVIRDGSGIVNLAGLRGRSLIVQESPGTSLAEPWLTVLLWQDGLESPQQLLGRFTRSSKLSQVVLPVFFGQADACVVTRRGLNTMVELNPQLSTRLKVLCVSPQMQNAFFAWRKGYPEHLKKPYFEQLLRLRTSPKARQVLTLFQSPGFTARDADCLRPANTLLDAYERHCAPAAGGKR
jgi:phosphonate transport system substrate-binding protein